jgi:hypothetical protein
MALWPMADIIGVGPYGGKHKNPLFHKAKAMQWQKFDNTVSHMFIF